MKTSLLTITAKCRWIDQEFEQQTNYTNNAKDDMKFEKYLKQENFNLFKDLSIVAITDLQALYLVWRIWLNFYIKSEKWTRYFVPSYVLYNGFDFTNTIHRQVLRFSFGNQAVIAFHDQDTVFVVTSTILHEVAHVEQGPKKVVENDNGDDDDNTMPSIQQPIVASFVLPVEPVEQVEEPVVIETKDKDNSMVPVKNPRPNDLKRTRQDFESDKSDNDDDDNDARPLKRARFDHHDLNNPFTLFSSITDPQEWFQQRLNMCNVSLEDVLQFIKLRYADHAQVFCKHVCLL